jgi:ferredoxin
MTGILVSLGIRDVLTVDGPARVAEQARVAPQDVVRVEQLAERARTQADASLARLFDRDDAFVVGCSRPRAVRALLDFAAVDYRAKQIAWLALPFDRDALKTEYGVPWYPVIDRARCSGCGTCADYCLFSVYTQQAPLPAGERVRVAAPLNCKTGCPACARLCPEAALIFPFCHEAELNGEVEEPARRTRDTLAAALGDDPMRVLAERRKQKRLIDPAKFEQAEKDRVLYSGVL